MPRVPLKKVQQIVKNAEPEPLNHSRKGMMQRSRCLRIHYQYGYINVKFRVEPNVETKAANKTPAGPVRMAFILVATVGSC